DGEPLASVDDAGDYPIYLARGDALPIVEVVRKDLVHAAWSHLPRPGAHGVAARARVDLAGQGVSITGWSSIEGHTFHLRERVFAAPDHLWARAGAAVRVLGADHGDVAIEIDAPTEPPTKLEARAPCEAVVYASRPPDGAEDGPPTSRILAIAAGEELELFASPTSMDRIARTAGARVSVGVMGRFEERGGRVRVAGSIGPEIAFDAWAPIDQVTALGSRLGGSHRTRGPVRTWCRARVESRTAKVAREAELFVAGADVARRVLVGHADAGAPVSVLDESGDFARVVFDSVAIAPAEGERFYVRTHDLDFEAR
ncbi:MAG TPA: hypothetical protein VGM56_17915, partial [Byssovorax sp.]